jgi:hypothetical protein
MMVLYILRAVKLRVGLRYNLSFGSNHYVYWSVNIHDVLLMTIPQFGVENYVATVTATEVTLAWWVVPCTCNNVFPHSSNVTTSTHVHTCINTCLYTWYMYTVWPQTLILIVYRIAGNFRGFNFRAFSTSRPHTHANQLHVWHHTFSLPI